MILERCHVRNTVAAATIAAHAGKKSDDVSGRGIVAGPPETRRWRHTDGSGDKIDGRAPGGHLCCFPQTAAAGDALATGDASTAAGPGKQTRCALISACCAGLRLVVDVERQNLPDDSERPFAQYLSDLDLGGAEARIVGQEQTAG